MTKRLLTAVAIAAGLSSGCVYTAIAQSVAGQAWVAKGGSVWHCDATAGDPVCTEGSEAAATGAPAAPAAPGGG